MTTNTITFVEQNQAAKVYYNNTPLQYAWHGGLNSPQFSTIDLNQDGYLDLMIYDQKGNGGDGRILCYLNNGQTDQPYQYAPQYAAPFDTIRDASYITAKDFNKDQVPDLFVTLPEDQIGLLIYEGYYTADNQYDFFLRQTITDYTIDDLRKPSIMDVDGDGFLDILKLNTGDDGINFFRNLQRDTLAFEIEECWGDFIKVPLTNEIILDENCSHTPGEGKKALHFFSVLSAFDVDQDKDIDLFFSNSGSHYLTYAINGGSQQQEEITDFQYEFPSSQSIEIYSSPYVQAIDINNDAIVEWLITPQDPDNATTIENVHIYTVQQQGKDQFPEVELQTTGFMINEMIDVGELSHPIFFDHNQDGLMDLIVSNYNDVNTGNTSAKSNLTLFENIGTTDEAIFDLKDKDYLGLSEQNYFGMVPAFGDLDGDGDEDMVLTTAFKNYLFYFQNNPDAEGVAKFTLINDKLLALNNLLNKSPFLVDVNRDGLLDFIMGHSRGKIHYYQNISTPDSMAFELITDFWGQVDAQNGPASVSNPTPIVNDYNEDGILDLFLGDIYGHVQHYLVDAVHPDSAFTLVEKKLANISLGHRSTIAMHDLNNDGLQELLAGSFSGGLLYFSEKENDFPLGISDNAVATRGLKLYPNPSSNYCFIDLPSSNTLSPISPPLELYDYSGRLLSTQKVTSSTTKLDLGYLTSGIYLVKWGEFCERLVVD